MISRAVSKIFMPVSTQGISFASLIINKSLETLATIEAAAIEVIFSSPLMNSPIFYFYIFGSKEPINVSYRGFEFEFIQSSLH